MIDIDEQLTELGKRWRDEQPPVTVTMHDPARGGDDMGSFLETDRHLHVVRPRSTDGQPTERLPTAAATRRHRWRTITGVAAAVLLLAVGAVVGVARNDPSPEILLVAASGPRAEDADEVARGFLDAYGAFDADRAMTFLTRHALATEWGTPAQFRLELELLQASGWQQTILDRTRPEPPPGSDGCDAYKKTSAPGRLIVYCTYDYHTLRSDAIRRSPYGDAYWAFVVDKGRIVSAENRIGRGPSPTPTAPEPRSFDDDMWRDFHRWVSSTYPQDAAAMYKDKKGSDWKRSEESVRLWDQHTREYVAIGVPYVARAEAICTAARDRFKNSAGPTPVSPSDRELYFAMAARALDEALAELRAVPPPEAFRVQFEHAYALADQFASVLRGEQPLAYPGLRQALGAQTALSECTFDLPPG